MLGTQPWCQRFVQWQMLVDSVAWAVLPVRSEGAGEAVSPHLNALSCRGKPPETAMKGCGGCFGTNTQMLPTAGSTQLVLREGRRPGGVGVGAFTRRGS